MDETRVVILIANIMATALLTAGAWDRGWKGLALLPFLIELIVACGMVFGVLTEGWNSPTGLPTPASVGAYIAIAVVVGCLKFLALIVMCIVPRR